MLQPRGIQTRGRLRAAHASHLALLSLGLSLAACGGEKVEHPESIEALVQATTPSDLKVLVVGIDGATFSVIGPMVEAGELPNFAALMKAGSHGPLRSVSPSRSPSIWTSMATGRSAKVHGIESFVREDDPERLITSNSRRVNAMWNWASAFDRKVGFDGWWVTWPAEPVAGWMVSDRITRSRWSEWLDGNVAEDITYPKDLAAELVPLLVNPATPPMDEIDALVEFSDAERALIIGAEGPVFGERHSVFKFAYCSQRSYENIALHMLDQEQPDLMGVFLIANDSVCHTFWHFYEPDAFKGVDPDEAARLGKLIPAIQVHNDNYLEELLAKVDDNTVVLIVSDHGFQASGTLTGDVKIKNYKSLREEADKKGQLALVQPGMHHLDGILIAKGPYIRKEFKLKASIYDVAPTVLALMGLPVPANLEGRVLTEMIEPEFFEKYPIKRIDSYDRLLSRKQIDLPEDASDDQIMDQLRALGYVDPDGDPDDGEDH